MTASEVCQATGSRVRVPFTDPSATPRVSCPACSRRLTGRRVTTRHAKIPRHKAAHPALSNGVLS